MYVSTCTAEQARTEFFGKEIRRDGVHLRFYSDGSGPTFEVTAPGEEHSGINERLYARYRTEGRDPRDYRKSIRPTRESLILSPKAKTLTFTRDLGYCYMPYLRVNSDLARAFPPQPWARNLLPLVPVERLFAFAEGAPRSVLEFEAPRVPDEKLIGAAAWLVLIEWGMRPQDLLRVLAGMGLGCDARVLRRALAPFEARGLVRMERLRANWRKGSDAMIPMWSGSTGTRFNDGGPADCVALLQEVWSAFEPHCKVTTVTFDPKWWGCVKFQGFWPVLPPSGAR